MFFFFIYAFQYEFIIGEVKKLVNLIFQLLVQIKNLFISVFKIQYTSNSLLF